MTREEAIHCLSVHSSTNGSGLCTDEQHYEAKQMAIKALEQEPKIEKVIKMRDATPEERESIGKYIKSISKPTGIEFDEEQEPKIGHWILHNEGYFDESYVCSECDGDSPFDYKYCPNCGAKMD